MSRNLIVSRLPGLRRRFSFLLGWVHDPDLDVWARRPCWSLLTNLWLRFVHCALQLLRWLEFEEVALGSALSEFRLSDSDWAFACIPERTHADPVVFQRLLLLVEHPLHSLLLILQLHHLGFEVAGGHFMLPNRDLMLRNRFICLGKLAGQQLALALLKLVRADQLLEDIVYQLFLAVVLGYLQHFGIDQGSQRLFDDNLVFGE